VIPLDSRKESRNYELWGEVIRLCESPPSPGDQVYIPELIMEEFHTSIKEVFSTHLWDGITPILKKPASIDSPLSPLTPLSPSDESDEDIPELNLASKGKRGRSSSFEDEPSFQGPASRPCLHNDVTDTQTPPPPVTDRCSHYPLPSDIKTIIIDVELSGKVPYDSEKETSREWTNKERAKCKETLRKAASFEELQNLVSFIYLLIYLSVLLIIFGQFKLNDKMYKDGKRVGGYIQLPE
jgi:hypothetical protein